MIILITIFKTGDFDYSDVDPSLKKPVRYSIDNLMEVASRTSKINVTNEQESDVISEMSNFIVEDGLLKADEPNNLENMMDMNNHLLQEAENCCTSGCYQNALL